MAACHICLDELKKPISLPCGHIFCSECILQAVQSVKPATHLHTCPICRATYNVAPLTADAVPPNLRPFVTPHLRRVFVDPLPPKQKSSVPEVAPVASTSSSEISRLRAENSALRTSRDMWQKRAEMHGATNIDLMNFSKALRDQAALLAREKEELEKRCHSLKRELEDDESSGYQATFAQSFLRTSSITSTASVLDISDSVIFESSFKFLTPGPSSGSHTDPSIIVDGSDHTLADPSLLSSRKRRKLSEPLVSSCGVSGTAVDPTPTESHREGRSPEKKA